MRGNLIVSDGQFIAAQNDLVSVHVIHHHFHEIVEWPPWG